MWILALASHCLFGKLSIFFYRVASTGCFERAGLLVLVLPARLPLPGAPDWRSLGGPAGHTTFKIFPERNFIEA